MALEKECAQDGCAQEHKEQHGHDQHAVIAAHGERLWRGRQQWRFLGKAHLRAIAAAALLLAGTEWIGTPAQTIEQVLTQVVQTLPCASCT